MVDSAVMKSEVQKHHIQRSAERAVEAELNRRGISTAKTDTNEPGIDLVAFRPLGPLIPVEVKGLQKPNDWLIARPQRTDTVHFLVHVPTESTEAPGIFRFFILAAQDVQEEMQKHHEHLKMRPTWKPSIPWRASMPYENRWDKLEIT